MKILIYHDTDWGMENYYLADGINKYTTHEALCMTLQRHPFGYSSHFVCTEHSMAEIEQAVAYADFFHVTGGFLPFKCMHNRLTPTNHVWQTRGSDVRMAYGEPWLLNQLHTRSFIICGKGDYAIHRYVLHPITHLPNFVIDTYLWPPDPGKTFMADGTNAQPVRILHNPTNPHIKGSDSVIAAASNLSQKYNIEFVWGGGCKSSGLDASMSYQECMKLKRTCDIFVDQLLIGALGKASVEAMCLGVPTVGFMSKYWLSFFPDIPVANATTETIERVLEELITHPDTRQKLALSSREFCTRVWGQERAAKAYTNFYEFVASGCYLPINDVKTDYMDFATRGYYYLTDEKQGFENVRYHDKPTDEDYLSEVRKLEKNAAEEKARNRKNVEVIGCQPNGLQSSPKPS